MTQVEITKRYMDKIREATRSKSFVKLALQRDAYKISEEMGYAEHLLLMDHVDEFELNEIYTILGSGLKDPSRQIFVTRAAELEAKKFDGY